MSSILRRLPTAGVLPVATLLLVLSSAAGAADWKGTETTVDGTLHVKNPAEAIDPSMEIGLEEVFRLGGWDGVHPTFFMRQAGVFHFLVATVYLAEWRRYGSVRFLLLAKATAVAFLGLVWILGGEPWVVPLSGLADGLMGVAVLVLARRAGVDLSLARGST